MTKSKSSDRWIPIDDYTLAMNTATGVLISNCTDNALALQFIPGEHYDPKRGFVSLRDEQDRRLQAAADALKRGTK